MRQDAGSAVAEEQDQERRLAKRLEQQGEVDAAVRIHVRLGDRDEAVRIYMRAGRHREAGELIQQLIDRFEDVRNLKPEQRNVAKRAAVCFTQAGDTKRAVELYLLAGDPHRAAGLLERAGDLVGAARIREDWGDDAQKAQRLGRRETNVAQVASQEQAKRLELAGNFKDAMAAYLARKDYKNAAIMAHKAQEPGEAAKLFVLAAMPYPAAQCYEQIGELSQALDAVVRVPRNHDRYRVSALMAIRIASQLNVLEFQFDHFLSKLVQSGPQDDTEAAAFYSLAELYRRHDFLENALETLRRLDEKKPGYRDVPKLMNELNGELTDSKMVFEKIEREDASFRGDGDLASKHSSALAPLPSLPPIEDGAGQRPDSFGKTVAGPAKMERPPTTARMAGKSKEEAPVVDAGSGNLGPGTIVAERYRIEQEVGRGGMGAVFRAYDLELDELIALKFYEFVDATGEMQERFKRELALARRFAHRNIVQVFDIGTWRGSKFMSMELLRGCSLADKIAQGLAFDKACSYLAQACAGLGSAHQLGVVHRDVKPENLFVTLEDVVKVMDFGIAKSQNVPGITRTGFIAGSPHYIAPEQASAFGQVDFKADIYSLGAVAYQAFTGRPPFDHGEIVPLLLMHVNDPPPPPRGINPKIPTDIENLILKMLAKNPADRPASCAEIQTIFEQRLDQYARAREILDDP